MGLSRVFGVCAAFLFASSVTAANIIDLGPSDYRNWGSGSFNHTPQGINSKFGQTTRLPPTLNTLNVTRNPVIPYGSVANGLRSFTRVNPASAAVTGAITGLFLAVDWVFDQSRGEWTTLQEGQIDDASFGLWTSAGTCVISGPTPAATCQSFMASCSDYPSAGTATFSRVNIINATTAQCLGRRPGFSGELAIATLNRTANCPAGSTFNPSTGICTTNSAYLPVTSSDWDALEASLPAQPPALVGGAAGEIMQRDGKIPGYHDMPMEGPASVSGPTTTTTSTDPVTGETVVTSTSTQTNLNYGDTTITTNTTTTSTTYQNGQQTNTSVTTETPGELPVASSEWPGFCTWASVVCDWINWTREPPPSDQDLPALVDDDFFEQKNISFGSKSCPPDYEINLAPFLPTPVAVSFQPICDFASLIYYMVMAASYIIAAYISIGVARNA